MAPPLRGKEGRRLFCFLFLVFVIILYIAINLLGGRLHHVADRCGKVAPTLWQQQDVPQCLRAWVARDKAQVQSQLLDRGFALQLGGGSSSGSCQQRVAVYIDAYRSLLRYMHHMPHFAEVFFNFYSLLIWQGILLQESCIHSFIVDDSVNSFWQKSAYDADSRWMRDLVKVVDGQWNTNSVTSNSCYDGKAYAAAANVTFNGQSKGLGVDSMRPKLHNSKIIKGALHGWFLHPVDAVILQSAVLGDNPCAPVRKVLTDPNVQVLVLNRRTDRKLMHASAVAKFLQTKPFIKAVSLATFEDSPGSLRHQAKMLHDVQVLIATHGAGNTNIAFMRPCSIVIELFPRLFFIPHYFGSLAERAGLLHYPIQAAGNGTHYHGSVQPCCKKAFLDVAHLDTEVANAVCFQNSVCRSCARGVDYIEIDPTQLNRLLDQALAERSRCIQESIYYREL